MKKFTHLLALLAFLAIQQLSAAPIPMMRYTTPVDSGKPFHMITRNIWELTQIPSTAKETGRLKTSLQVADFEPVGLRASANVPLLLNVEQISGTGLPKLIMGTYDRQTVTTYNLTAGLNTITNANGGDLYLQYSSNDPSDNNRVKVTFQSGYNQMPLYILGATTNSDWLNMLSADTISPNATLVSNRLFVVVSRTKAAEYRNENQDTLLRLLDQVMQAEGDISGLDNSTPVHAPFLKNKLMLLEKASGNPDATSMGRVRIPTGSINWILAPSYILNSGGWGIFHEIGHHHQHWSWIWSTCIEVGVNIYSLAAKRAIHPGEPGIGASDWNTIFAYLALPDGSRNFNASSTALFTRLGMFHQLWLAYGDEFYHTLHKRSRDEAPSPVGDEQEMRLFMLYASQISGDNLSQFFRKWGFNVSESIYAEVAALGLPNPVVDPSLLRDDIVTSIQTPASDAVYAAGDTVFIAAAANGPGKVTKVEFFQNSTKLGEDTTAPYTFNWINAAPGHYALTTVATIQGGATAASSPVNITMNAISITSPLDGAAFVKNAPVPVSIRVASQGSPVQRIDYYLDNVLAGTATTAPYNISIVPGEGPHNLTAKVTWQNGDTASSASVGMITGGAFPLADAFVRDASYAGINYGTASTLVVKKDGNSGYSRISYIKFDLKALGNVNTAKLRLNIVGAGTAITGTQWQVWKADDDSWTETGINWNNKPAAVTQVASVQGKKTGYVEWDITNQVIQEMTGDKILSLVIQSSVSGQTNDATFSARENADATIRPVLLVYPDSIPPAITTPDTIHALNDTGRTTATVQLTPPAATDKSGIASITSDAPAAFPAGTTLVTWSVTDSAGNTAVAQQAVIVSLRKSKFGPVTIYAGTTNNSSIGRRADLRAELFLNGQLVGSGNLPDQLLQGNSLQSATRFTIPLLSDSIAYTPEDQLQLRISARKSGPNGTYGIRLYYNTNPENTNGNGYSKMEQYTPAGPGGNNFSLTTPYLLTTTGGQNTQQVMITLGNDFREIATWSTLEVPAAYGDNAIDYTEKSTPGLLIATTYPNPSTTDFVISLQSNQQAPVTITVMDFFGRTVKQLKFASGAQIRFGNDLEAGIYFAVIAQENRTTFVKLIKR
ncbi:putative secreted protein (Por secretion system target) [Chitinophaga dinghuensis]|uniref:Putative secreted protein (Por secretion system target) n=1 Tax=Chitinophaga dinghuensis TaxID=1539050 RepID=A0A327VYS2_9BACT|nr:M60 family metallopeptidase [Chitinophaga dinghuensis]RAJ80035.1 putative secreted protein (Por secretion system target) [Chitinophaga dinghuensis]